MLRQPTRGLTRVLTPCLLVALSALAAPALAQDGKNDAPLGGPDVTDRAPPGGRKFGEAGKGDNKFARAGQAHGAFMRAVRQLGGPEAPEGLALSDEQQKQIRGIEEEFREAMKAFRDQHKDELESLRKEAGLPAMGERPAGERGPGGPDGEGRRERPNVPPGKSDDPKVQAARDKMRALMEQGPKVGEYQTRQWAVLSSGQQTFVKDRMAQMQEQRGERGREGGPRGPGADGKRPGRGGPGGPEGEGRRPRGPRPPDGDAPPPPPPPAPEMEEGEGEAPPQE